MPFMQIQELQLDANLRELTVRGDPSFPIDIYYEDYSEFICPWHWHNEVEFAYVTSGTIVISIGSDQYTIRSGDGFFVNSNQLHSMHYIEKEKGTSFSMVFDPRIISGATHSVIEQKYVLPLTRNEQVKCIVFRPDVEWQNNVISLMKQITQTYSDAPYGFEITVSNYLAEIWLTMVTNLQDKIAVKKTSSDDGRVKKMLTFINEKYMERITLEDIASSANVSIRECCRSFKEFLATTPFSYLLNFRIRVAAQMLSNTNNSITDICFATGFKNTSYFGKVFREGTGLSPREFRKKHAGVSPLEVG